MKRLMWARSIALTLAALLLCGGSARAAISDGLVSYWPLNDSFVDVVGQNDGELMGSDPDPVFEAGKLGNGIKLDGIDQFIEIGGDESNFDFVGQDFSVSAWFRVDSFDKSWQALIAKGEGNRWRVHRRDAGSILTWNGGNADVPEGDNPPIDDGELHHFVGVSTADAVYMYINGELVAEGAAPITENNDMPVMIGENPDARGRTWNGLIDDVAIWGRGLDEAEVSFLWNNGNGRTPSDAGAIPPLFVGGENTIGNRAFSGKRSNLQFGPAQLGEGLLQSWYAGANPGSKDAIDGMADAQEPIAPAFRPSHGSSWWTGNQEPFTDELVKYPEEVIGDAINESDASNYVVKASGQLLIPESGTYRFTDGIDDYTYLAVDSNKNGVAGDVPEEVLIDDNAWTDVYRTQNGGGGGFGEADFTVAQGGEWLAVEFAMGEGGGTDAGIIYWDYDPSAPAGQRLGGAVGFPDDASMPIDPTDAETMYIPNSHLRSDAAPLVSGLLTGKVEAARPFQLDVNCTTDQSDTMSVENRNPAVFKTTLDVAGATFEIKSSGACVNGDSFKIINADTIIGTPTITSATAGQVWTFNATTGRVTLGGGVAGDFNGNGVLDAADIDSLTQASAAGTNVASFDLSGDAKVDGTDINRWVRDLKRSWIGDANLDGQFNSSDLVTLFAAGTYENGSAAKWTTGDFTGDGLFTTSDLVAALSDGGYEQGARTAVSAVPEPASATLLLIGSLLAVRRRRK